MSSDNVILFTYTTPLPSLGSWTSEKMILGQYISLSSSCYGDQTFNFVYQFSGDGTNWDIAESTQIQATTGSLVTSSVKAKWTRIRLVSTSGLNQTELRVYVYGTPSNSAITAQLSGIGNFNPKVDISADIQRTAFDEILVQNYKPSVSFKWDQLVGGALYNANAASRFQSPYLQGFDLWVYSGGISSDGIVVKGNSTLRLSTNETSLGTQFILGTKLIPYSAGVGVEALFTGAWHQPTIRTNNQRQLFGVFNVNGALGNGTLYDGFMIGYDNTSVTSSELEIAWYKAGVLVQRIPQSNWNIDPCNGSVKAPNIAPENLNVFKLSMGYLGVAGCLFSILGTDGRFYPFHRIVPQNNSPNTQFAISAMRLGLLLQTTNTSTSVDGYLETGSMSMGLNGERHSNSYLISRNNTLTATTTETCVIAIRNLDSTNVFMGLPNHLCYALESLSIAVTSNNVNITRINVYKNLTSTTGAYVSTGNLNNSTSIATNETNFATGFLVKTLGISQDASLLVGLDDNEEAIRNMNWTLQPGENYCITCVTNANTSTVSCAINWHHV